MVYVFDRALVISFLALNKIGIGITATTLADTYVLFGGGSSGATFYANVEVFNMSLVKLNDIALSTPGVYDMGAASVGDYAVFSGGYNYQVAGYRKDAIEVIDKNLVRTNELKLAAPKTGIFGVHVGSAILLAGGSTANGTTTVPSTSVEVLAS